MDLDILQARLLQQLQAMADALPVRPLQAVVAGRRQQALPGLPRPVDTLTFELSFQNCRCAVGFSESVVKPGLFAFSVDFHRDGQRALFLRDWLTDRRVAGVELMRFESPAGDPRPGIDAFVRRLGELLAGPLRPLLDSELWMAARMDWEGHR